MLEVAGHVAITQEQGDEKLRGDKRQPAGANAQAHLPAVDERRDEPERQQKATEVQQKPHATRRVWRRCRKQRQGNAEQAEKRRPGVHGRWCVEVDVPAGEHEVSDNQVACEVSGALDPNAKTDGGVGKQGAEQPALPARCGEPTCQAPGRVTESLTVRGSDGGSAAAAVTPFPQPRGQWLRCNGAETPRPHGGS